MVLRFLFVFVMSDSHFFKAQNSSTPLFKPQIINLLGWEQLNYYHCIQVSQNLCGYVQMGRIIHYLCKAVRIFPSTCKPHNPKHAAHTFADELVLVLFCALT